jgi:hypothetical protein
MASFPPIRRNSSDRLGVLFCRRVSGVEQGKAAA